MRSEPAQWPSSAFRDDAQLSELPSVQGNDPVGLTDIDTSKDNRVTPVKASGLPFTGAGFR